MERPDRSGHAWRLLAIQGHLGDVPVAGIGDEVAQVFLTVCYRLPKAAGRLRPPIRPIAAVRGTVEPLATLSLRGLGGAVNRVSGVLVKILDLSGRFRLRKGVNHHFPSVSGLSE